jgi:hypothetical protein
LSPKRESASAGLGKIHRLRLHVLVRGGQQENANTVQARRKSRVSSFSVYTRYDSHRRSVGHFEETESHFFVVAPGWSIKAEATIRESPFSAGKKPVTACFFNSN